MRLGFYFCSTILSNPPIYPYILCAAYTTQDLKGPRDYSRGHGQQGWGANTPQGDSRPKYHSIKAQKELQSLLKALAHINITSHSDWFL